MRVLGIEVMYLMLQFAQFGSSVLPLSLHFRFDLLNQCLLLLKFRLQLRNTLFQPVDFLLLFF
jgi:hypothetical protein